MIWVIQGEVGASNAVATPGRLTVPCAAVHFHRVTVVTAFLPLLNKAITTASTEAETGATVGVVFVAIIAGLKTGFAALDVVAAHAVAAAGFSAIVGAGIVVALVAVIAAFETIAALGEIQAFDTIATTGLLTIASAGVLGGQVAIIAFLAGLEVSIATTGETASGRAVIGFDIVAVVAGLKALAALKEILADVSIAAAGTQAAIGAGIVVDRVAVVAFLAAVHGAIATGFATVALGCWVIATDTDEAVAAVRFGSARGVVRRHKHGGASACAGKEQNEAESVRHLFTIPARKP